MKKLYKERLLQVVRVLEELPKEKRFALESWNVCNTVGCAVGWAASDPWFTRRGLCLVSPTKIDVRHFPPSVAKHFKAGAEVNDYGIYYCGRGEWTAVEVFFGHDRAQVKHLFHAGSYYQPTKRNVIRRIKKFVSEN